MRCEHDPVDADPGSGSQDNPLRGHVRKGRGAVSNRAGRFEPGLRPLEDDGWLAGSSAASPTLHDRTVGRQPVQPGNARGRTPAGSEDTGDDDLPPLATTVALDSARTVISRNTSPDIPFDQSINPYRGCEHGCVYCYARPTHAYLGHSPGLDFETRLYMKADAAHLLEKELRRPGYRPSVIMLGANTDPYQPIERRHRITREILEVLAAFDHPVGITTKSASIVRDMDILAPMARKGLVRAYLSVTTLDSDLARVMEPRASTPRKRLEAIRRLHESGVPAGVSVAPIIPGLTDHEIEAIIGAAAAAGADSVSWALLRLPLEIKDLFSEWLEAHRPLRAKRVLDLVRDCRGGELYDADFGARMKGTGPYAELIGQRVLAATRRNGLGEHHLDTVPTLFRVPRDCVTAARKAAGGAQLGLFD